MEMVAEIDETTEKMKKGVRRSNQRSKNCFALKTAEKDGNIFG